MKNNFTKITSLLLILVMLFSFFTSVSAENTATITIYFTVSNQGIIALANDSSPMANKAVTVTDTNGDSKFTVDEALIAAHAQLYSADGYSAPDGYVSKLWGVETLNTLFFVNNAGLTAGIGTDTVKNGDKLVASINKDNVTYSDWYTFFDTAEKTVVKDELFELTLKGHPGMAYTVEDMTDIPLEGISAGTFENGSFIPFENNVTDENGKIFLSFSQEGTYFVTASGSVSDCPIIAPVCIITVSDTLDTQQPETPVPPTIPESPTQTPDNYEVIAEDAMHNIANKYSNEAVITHSSREWLLADIISYNILYPEYENTFSESEKQACLDKIIEFADNAVSPGDLSKAIIALRASGCDARNIYNSSLTKIDVVEKLNILIDSKDSSVINEYTLPYVIIALNQGDGYATREQMNYLLNSAVQTQDNWKNLSWGSPDAATPMILALSPYYNTNESIKTAVDDAVQTVKSCIDENGMIGKNAPSTGLAVAALTSVGIDVTAVDGKNMIIGLMTSVTDNLDGFMYGNSESPFATEQAFRGLVQWRLSKIGKRIYDFKDMPLNEAHATWANNCPVTFKVIPNDATVTVEGTEPVGKNSFDLMEGTYTYTVSKPGYLTKTDTLTVTAEESALHTQKEIFVSLRNDVSSNAPASTKITVRIKLMTHPEAECGNSYTYKNNASRYTAVAEESLEVEKGSTVFDVFDRVCEKNNITYIEKDGYISAVNGLGEFDHGAASGWMFTLNGIHQNQGCRDTVLSANATVVWFYTDDYTNEKGAENYKPSTNTGTGSSQTDESIENSNKTEITSTITPSASVNKDGVTVAKVSEKEISNAAKNAENNIVTVTPQTENAKKISVEFTDKATKKLADTDNIALTVSTAFANITVTQKSLSQINGALTVSAEADGDIVKIKIEQNDEILKTIDGGIQLSIPLNSENIGHVLAIVDENGNETIIKKSISDDENIVTLLIGSGTVKLVNNKKSFPDTDNHWSSDAVTFVSSREIFSGTDNGFEPDNKMSRAMMVTTLFRLEGATAGGKHSFTDVADNTWYTDAVSWANTNKIVEGANDGFKPDENITREQLAAILYRYACHIGLDTSLKADTNTFSDSQEVSSWAKESVNWAAENGLITGKPQNKLDPQGFATRAEVAAIYQRLINLMLNN